MNQWAVHSHFPPAGDDGAILHWRDPACPLIPGPGLESLLNRACRSPIHSVSTPPSTPPPPTGTAGIRYAHTNLTAGDWRRLMAFYVEVFGCEPVSSERDNQGPHFDALTGLAGGSVRGRHLRLPGHGERGPTLEIFQFNPQEPSRPPALNRPGFAHIAFEVPDVEAKRAEILRWGGKDFGQLVTIDIPGAGRLTLIYMMDPEGNIVELQRWH